MKKKKKKASEKFGGFGIFWCIQVIQYDFSKEEASWLEDLKQFRTFMLQSTPSKTSKIKQRHPGSNSELTFKFVSADY